MSVVVAAAAAQQAARQAATQAVVQASTSTGWGVDPLPHAELGAIRIRRRTTFRTGPVDDEWNLSVDGAYVDFLGLGEGVSFYVHPGWHTVEVRPPRGAPPVAIQVAPAAGDVVRLACWVLRSESRWRTNVQLQLHLEHPFRVVGHPSA